MKVGVIGLGDIAQKAYLPIITSMTDVDPVFCTRTRSVLHKLSDKYHVDRKVESVEELLELDIEAAFVHTATEAHYEITKKLLNSGIHTYVDKPAAYSYKEVEAMVELARKKSLVFMTGFNRRYVPTYKELSDIKGPKIIIMEKNRKFLPDSPRNIIFDDFIHVVDTLRYMLDTKVENMYVDAVLRENNLIRIILTLKSGENTAVGIMNRDNAVTEEELEIIGSGRKKKVKNLTEITEFKNNGEHVKNVSGWNRMEYNRGFVDMVKKFLQMVKEGSIKEENLEADLKTHKICEDILKSVHLSS
ncbi:MULTISPECIES: Gfo/Idh/MocA family protein [unclassified Halanaerobium]|uniref:Gfo/Idh/MocA family protein n=1 Tax=unclassified Halanaerobium TaxID=2641197 RepID=UPI000DF13925|nr:MULTISPECIES: Gfo/Idh/MocA family oxidoreductase [unclassified Halanaerobium]RCW49942.1 virulence factor [Halanaerobium sp. MA284_MarDTE_T2]RCW81083.1 virulence factor [Halanaerobium sp. DL-01]